MFIPIWLIVLLSFIFFIAGQYCGIVWATKRTVLRVHGIFMDDLEKAGLKEKFLDYLEQHYK